MRASKPSVKNDPTSSAPIGQVTAQSPSGGTAAPGSTVTITVSGGAVTVPSVVGDSQATATQILTQAGFQVSVQQGSGPSQFANGTVFSQLPAANGTAAKGSTVTIYVQNGASASTRRPRRLSHRAAQRRQRRPRQRPAAAAGRQRVLRILAAEA